jgi:hypothetical protein
VSTYHITVIYETSEYYRVEASSEEEAKEKVLEGPEDNYNWDQTFQDIKVEKLMDGVP